MGRGRAPRGRRGATLFALAAVGGVWGGGWAGEAPASDPLWIALVHVDGSLTPIAQERDGVWDRPWPSPFRPILRVDSAGVLRPLLGVRWHMGDEPWALPVEMSDSGRATLTAPREWFLYSDSEGGAPLSIRELRLAPVQCLHEWVLDTDRRDLPALERRSHRPLAGVAFSRPVEPVAEGDIPGLDRVREGLGYVDGTGEKTPTHVWLGFHRVAGGTTVLGVMNVVGYEGERFDVVEIDGEAARVLVRAAGGSC